MVIFNMVGGGGQKKLKTSVYGCQIAIDDPDPATRVSYSSEIFGQPNGAASIVTPANGTGENCLGDWAGCNLISGIHRELGNATNGWTTVADKRSAVVGNGENDAMVYIPTWFFRMENDGTNITIGFSDTKIDGEWKDYAGSVGTNRVGHFRVGCYAAYSLSSKLYSRGSVKPSTSISLGNLIPNAKARGTGYDIMTWYQWTYLAALATLLYKSTNLQAAMAQGYVSGTAIQTESPNTYYNDYGMAGSSSGTDQMSFFWIQNLWGNMPQFVGGAKTDSSRRLMTCTGYSSTMDSNFDKTSLTPSMSSFTTGIISKVTGTTDTGFFPTATVGSTESDSKTYFADDGYVGTSYFPYVGGGYSNGYNCGPFSARFNVNATDNYSTIGSRLSYRL